jgi:hypothetical protein
MDIENKTVWVIACGEGHRDFSKVCLDWDVVLCGRGINGPYADTKPEYRNKNGCYRKFAKDVKDGDVVILRLGTSRILGVGMVVGEYGWSELFGDIDGWDLQNYRRVKWLWHPENEGDGYFKYALTWGGIVHILTSDVVKDWLKSLTFTEETLARPLKKLPKIEPKKVTPEEIGKYLSENGISNTLVETLLKELDELKRLAKWYHEEKLWPSEYETVAYLVVPILRALGWTHQKMAIEWNHIDLALFDRLPRQDENLAVVVEVKRKGCACLYAKEQAKGYAQGKNHCKRLIVTDGLCYGTYEKGHNGEWNLKPSAYFNLQDLRDEHPIYDCGGAKEALQMMAIEWKDETL